MTAASPATRDFAIARERAVADTLTDNPDTVAAWLAGTPKTWGALAGSAVGAARRSLGRDLSGTERRAVWQALWDRLQALPRGEGR